MNTQRVQIDELMQHSGVGFGTSGARGLASEMTDRVCYAYTRAFLAALERQGELGKHNCVAIAGDLRPSTPRILTAVATAIRDAGLDVEHCGAIPTPALAFHAMTEGMASIMVTGSHIPEDRNGIKFYKPSGEILKADEARIRAQSVEIPADMFDACGALLDPAALPEVTPNARERYIRRYTDLFHPGLLQGRRIGVYEHSSVARDLLAEILDKLGAEVIRLGRSDLFIPVDTEAIRSEDVALAAQWSASENLDCIVSADGDGDRPLIADERGRWLRGDIAGILCARFLGARCVVTPISSNTAVERSGWFERVVRTRIGSPYVIAAMQQAEDEGWRDIVGYEANGGFLLQSDLAVEGRILAALPTRDAILVPLAILSLAESLNCSISALCAQLPARFTFSDRLKAFPTELARARLAPMMGDDRERNRQAARALLGEDFGEVAEVDTTDGVRITLSNGDIVHFRPSGNAPELRCYTESDSEGAAIQLNRRCMKLLRQWLPESPEI